MIVVRVFFRGQPFTDLMYEQIHVNIHMNKQWQIFTERESSGTIGKQRHDRT